ncbi:hypothetical protein BBJ28_00016016, partial [Nothophytophthora sp. Chile5]
SRREIIARYLEYAEALQAKWGSARPLSDSPYTMATSSLMKPLLALFKCVSSLRLNAGEFGGKAFKREISAQWANKGPRPELREMIENAMKVLPDKVLDARIEDELLQQQQQQQEESQGEEREVQYS